MSSQHVRKLVAGQKPAKNRNGGRAYTNKSSNTNGFSNSNSYNNRQQQQQQTAIWNIVPTMYNQANSFGQVNYNTHQQPIHNNQNRNMPFIPKFEPGHLLDRPTTFTYGNSLLGMPPNKIPSTPFVNQSFNGQSRHSNKPNKETVRKKSTQNDVERIGSTKLNGHADIKENNHNDSNAEEIAALPDMNDVSIRDEFGNFELNVSLALFEKIWEIPKNLENLENFSKGRLLAKICPKRLKSTISPPEILGNSGNKLPCFKTSFFQAVL